MNILQRRAQLLVCRMKAKEKQFPSELYGQDVKAKRI